MGDNSLSLCTQNPSQKKTISHNHNGSNLEQSTGQLTLLSWGLLGLGARCSLSFGLGFGLGVCLAIRHWCSSHIQQAFQARGRCRRCISQCQRSSGGSLALALKQPSQRVRGGSNCRLGHHRNLHLLLVSVGGSRCAPKAQRCWI